ncbi:MAG TPA: outer membrane beta-barrel protein [Polyangiaceae bacterium]|nr:outer membrane beta-barrel protein [Polyangiaceae bacterium]
MRMLKLATLLGAAGSALFAREAAAQPRLGAGLVYGTDIEEVGVQLNGYYGLDGSLDGLRLGAEFAYYFVDDPASFWTVDLNGQYRFVGPGPFGAYFIAGLDIARFSIDVDLGPLGDDDVSDTEVGLNLGIGAEYAVSHNVELFGELKYVISDYDQAVFAVGARFLL